MAFDDLPEADHGRAGNTMRHDTMTFSALIDAYQIEIMRYLLRMTGNRADAEDLFQETFLRAFKAYGRLRASSNHRAWIYRIATNAFLNHRRARHRRREVDITDMLSCQFLSRRQDGPGLLSMREFARALGRLSRRQRAAFVQRKLHGHSYDQIADSLDCTVTAARANVYQAARRLRRELCVRVNA